MEESTALRALEKPQGLLGRLIAWIKRQLGRLNNLFRKRKSTTLKPTKDDDTVTSGIELLVEPTKSIIVLPAAAEVPEQAVPESTPDATPGLRRRSTKKEEEEIISPPPTMEAAMEIRRPSLPMSELTKKFSPKGATTKSGRSRRASYAIGTKITTTTTTDSSGDGGESRRASYAIGTTPASKIDWVKESHNLLKKTEAGQKIMTDGSLERSITRINEDTEGEVDPKLAWEKPEWAKEGTKKLRKSIHQLW